MPDQQLLSIGHMLIMRKQKIFLKQNFCGLFVVAISKEEFLDLDSLCCFSMSNFELYLVKFLIFELILLVQLCVLDLNFAFNVTESENYKIVYGSSGSTFDNNWLKYQGCHIKDFSSKSKIESDSQKPSF